MAREVRPLRLAQASLDQARRSREGALMGAIGAGDGLVQTAAQIGQKLEQQRQVQRVEETKRAEQTRGVDEEIENVKQVLEETREEIRKQRAIASDPDADPEERLQAAKRAQLLGQAMSVMGDFLALRGTDPERLREALAVLHDHRDFVLATELDTRDVVGLTSMGTSEGSDRATRHRGAAGIAVLSRDGTLSHIAAMTGIPVERLQEFNARYGIDLSDPTRLPIGQRVLVPMDEVQPRMGPPQLTAQEMRSRQELGLPLDYAPGMDIFPGGSDPEKPPSEGLPGIFDEGRAFADGVRDAYGDRLAEVTRSIVDAGRGGPVAFIGTLPLHVLDQGASFSAGLAQGMLNTAEGVTDMVSHPVDTTLGVASLIDRAAQATPAGRTFEFLAEAAFGKYGTPEEALEAYRQRMDPASVGAAQYALARDLTAAQFEQSLRLAREGRYSQAMGVLYGENVEVMMGGILGRGGRLARFGAIAEDTDDLSRLRRLYGDGPEAASMQIVDGRQARLRGLRQHHVFPQEMRTFFEERGFTGERDIDRFCVDIDQATHEAIHGGGDWRLGRKAWEDEWNRRIVSDVLDQERILGRKLDFSEVLELGLRLLQKDSLPVEFVRYRRRR